MLIDWFTVAAQVVNFIILVWLLKRFLYKPILDAVENREKLIATELADAASKVAEATKEREEFQQKNDEFDQQRATLLNKATDDAKVERQRLFDEARKAADDLIAKRRETARSDALKLNQALLRRTQREVFEITRKTLADLASTSLEERLVEVFTRRLRGLDGNAKADLETSLKSASEPARVRTTFELPAEPRAALQTVLNETFSAEIPIQFETSPDLISGIEFSTNGVKLAWSIANYLTSLERGVVELLNEQAKPSRSSPGTKSESHSDQPQPHESQPVSKSQ